MKFWLFPSNLDNYHIKRSIFKNLNTQLINFKGIVIDIGSGNVPYKSFILAENNHIKRYIAIDLKDTNYYQNPDLKWDGRSMPLHNNSVDVTIATEVLEHCPDPQLVLAEVFRVLKPDGILFFTVPFLWPFHDVPHDEYRFTPFALKRLLGNVGFTDIDLQSFGGWDAGLAQILGLWVRRRPMSRLMRGCLSFFVWPLLWCLYKLDKPSSEFYEFSIMTGCSGQARKPLVKCFSDP